MAQGMALHEQALKDAIEDSQSARRVAFSDSWLSRMQPVLRLSTHTRNVGALPTSTAQLTPPVLFLTVPSTSVPFLKFANTRCRPVVALPTSTPLLYVPAPTSALRHAVIEAICTASG